MSIVIYGPRGCGKTRNAEAFRKFYNCKEIVDDGKFVYPVTEQEHAEFKAGNILYLTDELPPFYSVSCSRRYIPFYEACRQSGVRS